MIDRLDAIYAKIPSLDCKRLCQESCGPIAFEDVEGVRCDFPTIRGTGGDPLSCNKLTYTGLCSVYADRPAICRLWGVVETMPCPHGCQPERWLTREEGFEILKEVRELDQGLRRRNRDRKAAVADRSEQGERRADAGG